MYYKIENKECDVYKQLHALRSEELSILKENVKAIEEKTGLIFTTYLGDDNQQSWRRVTQYTGFKFTEPEKVDAKIWKAHEEHKEVFIPNRRTKLGREMAEFLLNGLKGSIYSKVWKIMKLEQVRRFSFPYVEIVGDCILIFLSDNQEPKDENVIEITKREFDKLLTPSPNN